MLGLFPNALYTPHIGQTGGRGLSPRLWSRVNGQALSPDGLSNGFFTGDDFLNFGLAASGKYIGDGGFYLGALTAGNSGTHSIAQYATGAGGICRLEMGGSTPADNDSVVLGSCGGTGVLGAMDPAAPRLTIFEARVRFGQIANQNAFVGLAGPGLASATALIPDNPSTTYLADVDSCGFLVNEGAASALKFVYNKASATQTHYCTVAISSVQTLVATTWYKIGFVYDPTAEASKQLKVYVDNVENATTVSNTDMLAATGLFPGANPLAFYAMLKNSSTGAESLDLDWWAFYQAGQ